MYHWGGGVATEKAYTTEGGRTSMRPPSVLAPKRVSKSGDLVQILKCIET